MWCVVVIIKWLSQKNKFTALIKPKIVSSADDEQWKSYKSPSLCLLKKDELTDSTHKFIFLRLYLHIVHTATNSKTIKTLLIKHNKSHSFFLLRVKNFTFSSHARLRKKFLFCIFFTLLFYSDALSHSLTHSSIRSLLREMRSKHTELNQQLKVHLKKLFLLACLSSTEKLRVWKNERERWWCCWLRMLLRKSFFFCLSNIILLGDVVVAVATHSDSYKIIAIFLLLAYMNENSIGRLLWLTICDREKGALENLHFVRPDGWFW